MKDQQVFNSLYLSIASWSSTPNHFPHLTSEPGKEYSEGYLEGRWTEFSPRVSKCGSAWVVQHHSNSASGHACYTQCLSRTIAAGWDSVANVLDSFVRSCFLNALNFGGSILCLLYLNFDCIVSFPPTWCPVRVTGENAPLLWRQRRHGNWARLVDTALRVYHIRHYFAIRGSDHWGWANLITISRRSGYLRD